MQAISQVNNENLTALKEYTILGVARKEEGNLIKVLNDNYTEQWLSVNNFILNEFLPYIGYFTRGTLLPVQKGMEVTIPKGTVIKSTHPQGDRVAKRSFKVKVHHLLSGSHCPKDWLRGYDKEKADELNLTVLVGEQNEEQQVTSNPSVRWVGASGYWMQADINEVLKANKHLL